MQMAKQHKCFEIVAHCKPYNVHLAFYSIRFCKRWHLVNKISLNRFMHLFIDKALSAQCRWSHILLLTLQGCLWSKKSFAMPTGTVYGTHELSTLSFSYTSHVPSSELLCHLYFTRIPLKFVFCTVGKTIKIYVNYGSCLMA